MSQSETVIHRIPNSLSAANAVVGCDAVSGVDQHQTPRSRSNVPSLRVNVSWTFLGFAVHAASQWGVLAILAHLCGPDGVGQFALALATTAPIMLLAGMELRLVQSADTQQKYAFAEYLAMRLIGVVVALGVIAAIAITCGFSAAGATLLFAVGLSKGAEAVADVFYGQFQQQERMDLVARSLILRATVSLIAFAVTIFVTNSLVMGVYLQSVAWLLVVLTFDIPAATQFLPSGWNSVLRHPLGFSQLSRLLHVATPAGLRTMLLSLENNLPHYFLRRFSTDATLGVFAALAYSLIIVQTFARSVNQPAIPRFAILHSQGDRAEFARLLRRLCGMGFVVGVCGLLAVLVLGRAFLNVAYGSEFAPHSSVLTILMAACAVRLLVLPIAASMAGTNRFVWLFRTQLSAVIVLAATASFLVPAYGLTGAATSVLVVSFFMLAIYAWGARVLLQDLFVESKSEQRGDQT